MPRGSASRVSDRAPRSRRSPSPCEPSWPAPRSARSPRRAPEATRRVRLLLASGAFLGARRSSSGSPPLLRPWPRRPCGALGRRERGGRGVESLRSGGGPGSSAGSSSRCHPPLPSSPRRTTASTHPGPMRPSPQWASASSGRRSRRYSGTPIVSDSSRRCLGSPSTTTAAAARTR